MTQDSFDNCFHSPTYCSSPHFRTTKNLGFDTSSRRGARQFSFVDRGVESAVGEFA